MGRPTKRTEEIIKRVIEGLSKGTPLAVICREDDMPDDDSIRLWAQKDEELLRAIARARQLGFDAIADNVRSTARGKGDSTGDFQRDRLIIETDLKLLAKWDPKRYGDKITQEISGPDGAPIQSQAVSLDPAQEAALQQVIEDAKSRIK
jgi:hypothetical protein